MSEPNPKSELEELLAGDKIIINEDYCADECLEEGHTCGDCTTEITNKQAHYDHYCEDCSFNNARR